MWGSVPSSWFRTSQCGIADFFLQCLIGCEAIKLGVFSVGKFFIGNSISLISRVIFLLRSLPRVCLGRCLFPRRHGPSPEVETRPSCAGTSFPDSLGTVGFAASAPSPPNAGDPPHRGHGLAAFGPRTAQALPRPLCCSLCS